LKINCTIFYLLLINGTNIGNVVEVFKPMFFCSLFSAEETEDSTPLTTDQTKGTCVYVKKFIYRNSRKSHTVITGNIICSLMAINIVYC
jgi:hypothetical protein